MFKRKQDDNQHKDAEMNDKIEEGEEAQADDGEVDAETEQVVEEQEANSDGGDDDSDGYKKQAEENYDKYLRALAEFDNYKKRTIKERAELLKYSGENLARDILIIVDDLERALNSVSPAGEATEGFVDGIKLIAGNLLGVLKKHQIEGEESVGKPFDPQKHEAMATVPTADYEPGTIIEEITRLYLFKDRVLRIGQVVVAKEVPAGEE